MNNKNLLLIDGFNLLTRGYFATSYNRREEELSTNNEGLYNGAIRVFMQRLNKLIRIHQITDLAIAWDVKREESIRRLKYPFYKANRSESPEPLIQQYHTLKTVLAKANVHQLLCPPYEADDLIGALSKRWSEEGYGHCYIYSSDKDLFQLLNEHVTQIIPKKDGDQLYTIEQFKKEFDIEPYSWVHVKALLGDPSDNIPGCPGIGAKTALPLIQQYQTVENLYQQLDELDSNFNRYKKKLAEGKESSFISSELAQICFSIPFIDELKVQDLKLNINEELLLEELNQLDIRIDW